MSPPEVWGPAVWTLFHTLSEKLNPNAYNQVSGSLFTMIVQICRVLPCPECSKDASGFLAKINMNNYKTKDEFKNMLYLFHNWVNAKKRKPLFNYANLERYSNANLSFVIKDFISKYNTKGNMKLLSETFQRSFVLRNFKSWINAFGRAFIPVSIPRPITSIRETPIEETPIKEVTTVEETPIEETPIEETPIEETLIEETPIEETLIEETPIEETPIEETLIEETPIEETPIEETPVKPE